MNIAALAKIVLSFLIIVQNVAEFCKENEEFSTNYFDENGLKTLGEAGEGKFNKVGLIGWTVEVNGAPTTVTAVVKIAKEENQSKELEKEAAILHFLHKHERLAAGSQSHPHDAACLEDTTKRLEHVPLMYGCFIHKGMHYLVMEHIPGKLDPNVIYGSTSSQEKEAQKNAKYNIWGFKEISPIDRLKIYKQMADALASIHSKGVVHGDIKPENMLMSEVTKDGKVFFIDFGVSTHGEKPKTCTINYADSKFVDSHTAIYIQTCPYTHGDKQDVYALGLSIFEIETIFSEESHFFKYVDHAFKSYSLTKKIEAIRKYVVENDWCTKTGINFKESFFGEKVDAIFKQMLDCERSNRPSATEVAERLQAIIEKNEGKPGKSLYSNIFDFIAVSTGLLI